jgi:hypothetical protein
MLHLLVRHVMSLIFLFVLCLRRPPVAKPGANCVRVALVMLTANCFVMDVSETTKTRVAAAAPVAARGLHSSSPSSAGGYDYLHAKFVYRLSLLRQRHFCMSMHLALKLTVLVLLPLHFFLFHHTQVHVQPAIQAGQQAESCGSDMYVPHVESTIL